jgi:hypothetical protein
MKRPAGVTASAVILAILSLLQIVFGLLMALAGTLSHEKGSPAAVLPGWIGVIMYELSALFLIFAVWGIATAIGLHRLRNWARFSTIIIGGLMAVFGLLMMLGGLVALVAPQLSAASAAAPHLQSAQLLVRVILGVTELIYAAIAGVGVWWLIYFNRRHVREVFAPPVELPVHPPTAA